MIAFEGDAAHADFGLWGGRPVDQVDAARMCGCDRGLGERCCVRSLPPGKMAFTYVFPFPDSDISGCDRQAAGRPVSFAEESARIAGRQRGQIFFRPGRRSSVRVLPAEEQRPQALRCAQSGTVVNLHQRRHLGGAEAFHFMIGKRSSPEYFADDTHHCIKMTREGRADDRRSIVHRADVQ